MHEYRSRAKEGHAAKIKSYSSGKDGSAFTDTKPWDGVPILDTQDKADQPQKVKTLKDGGKVEGKTAKRRLDRKPRKCGGRVKRDDGGAANDPETTVPVHPVDQKQKVRLSGYKNGGRAKRADGGRDDSYVGAGSVTRDDKPVMRPRDLYDADSRSPDAADLYDIAQMKRVERGYKKGGAVHPDEAEDKALIRKMVKPQDLRSARADGGSVKKKGSTTVVINLGAAGAGAIPPAPQRIPVPVPVPAGPGMAQPGAGGPPPGGAPMGVPGAPPPNPMARKRGGRVKKDNGGYISMKYGSRSGEGRLEKEEDAKKAGL